MADKIVNGASDATGAAIVQTFVDQGNSTFAPKFAQGSPGVPLIGVPAVITDNTAHPIIAAQGAGIRTYVTALTVSNSHATVGTLVTILDGVTAIYQGYVAAVSGSFSVSIPPGLLRTSANAALNAQCGTTGANVYVAVVGYQGA